MRNELFSTPHHRVYLVSSEESANPVKARVDLVPRESGTGGVQRPVYHAEVVWNLQRNWSHSTRWK